jgi:two-component system heavy metal sensor histidine kinase CusS
MRGEAEVALARARTGEEYMEVVASCLEESVRLSELIESLLFLARTESPGDHLKLMPQDLGQLLADLRDYYEATAAEIGVTLSVSPEEGGIEANVDRTLLLRAIGNLISNALAHSSAGGTVSLSAQRQGKQICIEVRDTGSGISASALPHVFDRFFRADPARSRNSGGVGLGLAIVQQIALMHKGQVKIDSNPGAGTRVSILLPAS